MVLPSTWELQQIRGGPSVCAASHAFCHDSHGVCTRAYVPACACARVCRCVCVDVRKCMSERIGGLCLCLCPTLFRYTGHFEHPYENPKGDFIFYDIEDNRYDPAFPHHGRRLEYACGQWDLVKCVCACLCGIH